MRRAGWSNPVTWVELARTFSLRALLQLAGFSLGLKAQQKVIDITEQFEETQSQFPMPQTPHAAGPREFAVLTGCIEHGLDSAHTSHIQT
jgi:hypothetical protein